MGNERTKDTARRYLTLLWIPQGRRLEPLPSYKQQSRASRDHEGKGIHSFWPRAKNQRKALAQELGSSSLFMAKRLLYQTNVDDGHVQRAECGSHLHYVGKNPQQIVMLSIDSRVWLPARNG